MIRFVNSLDLNVTIDICKILHKIFHWLILCYTIRFPELGDICLFGLGLLSVCLDS